MQASKSGSVPAACLRVSARESQLAEVRDFLTTFFSQHPPPPRILANLRLAVDDACNHIIGLGGERREIEVVPRQSRGWISVRIVLHGGVLPGGDEAGTLPAGLLLHKLVERAHFDSSTSPPAWVLRKKVPLRPQVALRLRYSARFAAALALLTVLACVPLWFLEGKRQRAAEEAALRSLAYGLVEVARPVLRSREEFTPEQTRLTEAVLAIRGREPRIVTAYVVDTENLVWAADRATATFTRIPSMEGLGGPDAQGVRTGYQRIENIPVAKLCVPVDAGGNTPRELGHVYLTVRWEEVEEAVLQARLRLLVGAAVVYLVATVIIAGLLGRVVVPLQRLLEGLRMGGGDRDTLAVDGPEEIGAIAAAFNDVHARMLSAEHDAAEHATLQQDLQLAREIQETLLPQAPPKLQGYELASWYLPAGDVGGDYFDFVQVNDHMTGVVVADVSGKGVPGSLIVGMLRTAIRMEARGNTNAGDVLARMNAFLAGDMRKGMFVTMFYVILDAQNRVVSYASAGHNPMVLYRAEAKETFFLKPRGYPVGLELPDQESFGRSLDVERLQLHPNDLLILYTDGITEAQDPEHNAFGEERLLAAIRRHGSLPARECVAAIEAELRAFMRTAKQSDDVTLVAIREAAGTVAQSTSGVYQRLVELIEKQGMSVEAACCELKVSPSTYYRFRPREPEPAGVGASPTASTTPALVLPPSPSSGSPAPGRSAAPSSTSVAGDAVATRSTATPVLDAAGLQGRAQCVQANIGCVELCGAVDSTSSAALETFVEAACRRWPKLVVSLQEVSYVSSRGWGVLASCANTLRKQRGELVIAGMPADLAHVYCMLGFEQAIRAFPDLERAREALDAPPVPAAAVRAPGRAKPRKNSPPPPTETSGPSAPPPAVSTPLFLDDEALTEESWESLRVRRGVVGPAGEVTLLALEGILDTVSSRFFDRVLKQTVDSGVTRILIDLSRAEFVSSSGWGAFTAYLRDLRQRSGDLKLFGMNPELRRIFDVLDLSRVLQRFDVLGDALEAFGLGVGAAQVAEDAAEICARCASLRLAPDAARVAVVQLAEGEFGLDATIRSNPEAYLRRVGGSNWREGVLG